jgi:DNA polymerase (family 10)
VENNKKIAGLFRQMAALLAEQGVDFKPAAYRRGAQVLDDLTQDVSQIGSVADLKKLPGIGDAMAHKIVEYLEMGRIKALDELRAEQGGISAELMDVEGLGPKRVRVLQSELSINSVADLVKAAKEGKIAALEGFDEIMEKKLLENAGKVGERITRFPREEVVDDVEMLLETIRNVANVDQCAIAGSYRREKETVGDIDILVVTEKPQEVSDAIAALKIVRDVVAHGDKKLSFDLKSGLRVDARFVLADQWGAALMYFTGSKEHNIAVRKKAIAKEWKLNEYGLFDGEEVVASKTEEDIYEALDLGFFKPRERTGRL